MSVLEEKLKQLQKPLTLAEIDFRVQSVNNGGYATILAYKDARVDINRLNKVFGVGYWQRKHELINGNLFCSVGIWNNEIKEWCYVQDVGKESYTEKEKGQASDSFKRACFNLGIGIELYDYPLISIKLHDSEWTKGEGNKPNRTTYKFNLKEWEWSLQMLCRDVFTLKAKDTAGNIRFNYKAKNNKDEITRYLMHQYGDDVNEIKAGIASDDLARASGYWFELDDDEKSELWIAESDGGLFSASERKTIQSSDFRIAYFGDAA